MRDRVCGATAIQSEQTPRQTTKQATRSRHERRSRRARHTIRRARRSSTIRRDRPRADGGGTRQVSHGATSTSAALSMRPRTDRCVTQPAADASGPAPTRVCRGRDHRATCTTAMHGTAARFEDQAGERDPLEDHGADRRQHRFGARRRQHQRDAAPAATPPTGSAARDAPDDDRARSRRRSARTRRRRSPAATPPATPPRSAPSRAPARFADRSSAATGRSPP